MTQQGSPDRIRSAAILIASLDPRLGERLLADLSPIEARQVRTELELLGDVDPAERQATLDAFRHSAGGVAAAATLPQSDRVGGVELTLSADVATAVDQASPQRPISPALDAAEVELVTEILNLEHPQTVALALSRMSDDRAAEAFAALAGEIKAEVLDRLSRLEPADEQSVRELESHLSERLEQQRQRKARAQAGAELVSRILAKTTLADRQTLEGAIAARAGGVASDVEAASSVADQSESPDPARSAGDLAFSQLKSTDAHHAAPQLACQTESAQPPRSEEFAAHSKSGLPQLLEDCSDELDQLDDATLLAALRDVGDATARLALAASSDRLFKRVAKKLKRRNAARLRKELRVLAPTPLSDLRSAQHAVLQHARHALSAEVRPAAA